MPYDPTQRGYSYIDGELPIRQRQPGTTRTAQVLPRKNYDSAELARQARHQAREEARQRNQPAAHTNAGIPNDYEEDYDPADIDGNGDVWPPRMPTSTRRYATDLSQGNVRFQFHPDQVQHIPPRRSAYQQEQGKGVKYTEDLPVVKPERFHVHWLVIFSLGMLVMIALWAGGSYFIAWWTNHQNDSAYGMPRTYQTDAIVGHSDSSTNKTHFIAINLNRHIVIIELPGGDSSKAKIYSVTTLYGDGQNLTPVTLSFKDVNGDGLLDMEIHIQDQTIVLINENGGFRPLKQGEHVSL
jgi:hypothetical protein